MEKIKCVKCQQIKLLDEFYKKGKRKQSYCKDCHNRYTHKRWKARKIEAVKLLGGKCCKCGYSRNYGALDFRHTDPSIKEHGIAMMVRMSWKKTIVELKKCVLLCKNCHAEEHYPQLFIDKIEFGKANSNLNTVVSPTGKCPVCEMEVFGTTYCSSPCASKARRKVDWPAVRVLENLMRDKPMTEIAKIYGVSDTAVRKWAKGYGLL